MYVNILKGDLVKHPENYQKWRGAPHWNSPVELHYLVDVIMHLLFLGIAKICKDFFQLD